MNLNQMNLKIWKQRLKNKKTDQPKRMEKMKVHRKWMIIYQKLKKKKLQNLLYKRLRKLKKKKFPNNKQKNKQRKDLIIKIIMIMKENQKLKMKMNWTKIINKSMINRKNLKTIMKKINKKIKKKIKIRKKIIKMMEIKILRV